METRPAREPNAADRLLKNVTSDPSRLIASEYLAIAYAAGGHSNRRRPNKATPQRPLSPERPPQKNPLQTHAARRASLCFPAVNNLFPSAFAALAAMAAGAVDVIVYRSAATKE